MPRIYSGLMTKIICILLLMASAVAAHGDDISLQRSCSQCGMDRKMYGYSRMLLVYADGTRVGVCSLHCAAAEMNSRKGKKIASVEAADRNSHELVPAEGAFWTIGGNRRGVMTKLATWAFVDKESAEKFVSRYGGRIISWQKVLESALKDAEQQ